MSRHLAVLLSLIIQIKSIQSFHSDELFYLFDSFELSSCDQYTPKLGQHSPLRSPKLGLPFRSIWTKLKIYRMLQFKNRKKDLVSACEGWSQDILTINKTRNPSIHSIGKKKSSTRNLDQKSTHEFEVLILRRDQQTVIWTPQWSLRSKVKMNKMR
jgi:hypothetical protein